MKRKIKAILLSLCLVAVVSCGGSGNNQDQPEEGVKVENRYARGYTITKYGEYDLVEIADPWNKGRILQRYVLVEKGKSLPDKLPQGTIIRTPVDRVVMYTTIHTSLWEQLGALDNVAGICEPEYLTSAGAIQKLGEGKIADCGKATSPNVEKIMDINGEVIIATPFENGGYGQAEKLGIPIFESADYMENHPLGRVEWIKVFGLLSGKEKQADSLFNATESNYGRLRELAKNEEKRPKLISERKYGSTWFTAGGASYMAVMYRDAGADYILADNEDTGSVPMSFEMMYEKGHDSDIWIFLHDSPYLRTYDDLKGEYTPYENFAPFKNRKIFVCNTVETPYYEYIALHPDYILEDFVKIFHPHLLPGYEPRCFKAMLE